MNYLLIQPGCKCLWKGLMKESVYSFAPLELSWSFHPSTSPLAHISVTHFWAQRVLHSLCTVYPLKSPMLPHSFLYLVFLATCAISLPRMYYVTLYSAFKFCRTEFSIYHPLDGRHFLTHHLGDCLRLLETLQKVPALLSLYPFSLISLKQATINLSSLHCSL